MESHGNRRARLTAIGIVTLFGAPLLAAPLALLLPGAVELGVGPALLWGLLSLSFGIHAASDYLAARKDRNGPDERTTDDNPDASATRRAA